jgi:hypothetical protein
MSKKKQYSSKNIGHEGIWEYPDNPDPLYTSIRVLNAAVPNQLRDNKNKEEKESFMKGLIQWTTNDQKRFIASGHTQIKLDPGVYEILAGDGIGTYFEKISVITHDLVRFPETNSDKVISEIKNFWEREEIFKKYKMTYKRGILLHGPAGSGKSITVRFIMNDIVERGGIVVKFTHPNLFNDGMRKLREIEPSTPVVVIMEDLDSIIETFSESEVLNILDGVCQIEKAVFLATTNYPENLGPRIINRPSRFDKRFLIPYPNEESRKLYFEHIMKNEVKKYDIKQWVDDTEGLSVAHLKELFTAVVIMGDSYEDAIENLRQMKDVKLSSDDEDDYKPSFGFTKNDKGKIWRKIF